ncbi:carbamoyltransferase HypF [Streptomyces physcomitrii]|uniref:Carbamoyltransferase n=1 Tax=Streptomyces physcomitrii TaxID=2724184 RepID=A0ABX1H4N4_9ACTN|nr:carbamoyltransferase HypF [Streptomyces physcomitrii]NKI42001.1 carbamoyltransferase HypF [Streptomyces physcomitrii]
MTGEPAQTVAEGPPSGVRRSRVLVRGVVQGVGFRPYVFALAGRLGLSGHVTNTGDGVLAEVEGSAEAVAAFRARIGPEAPPLARVESVSHQDLAAEGGAGFRITASRTGGPARTLVSPDTATCEDCLAELRDPGDRRHRHPFITCTNCGPRFTIVTGLPYDRAHTTMAGFPMCARCAAEYTDPADRRFHAQPVACHDCGPRLRLLVRGDGPAGEGAAGESWTEVRTDPVAEARRLLADGAIVAVKGLGGYHLACDAGNEASVRLLRERKARGGKPFAVMARSLDDLAGLVSPDAAERALLTGGIRPVVLLRRTGTGPHPALSAAVAPGSADLGVMLPYTPLHHLLLGLPGDPPGPRLLVMTSGNLGGEPIVTGEDEARERLGPLADALLGHDRPIHVPCDDSVVRVCAGEELPLRRSRGYAPLPVPLPLPVAPALAVGGDLKNTFCLGAGRRAWLSAHIGDMDDLATLAAFGRAERQLASLTGVAPELLAADRHPGYRSARWARGAAEGRPLHQVQHHHAHIASVLAENQLDGSTRVLGLAFDGTGYGEDGAVWGGEFLLADYTGFLRFAHLRYVPLPGGDAAVRHPWRMALAHLRAAGLPWDPGLPSVAACPPEQLPLLARQLERGINCVPTSSMGRLFDAVSSLAGICQHAGYEAQAALELEAAAVSWGRPVDGAYEFGLTGQAGAALRADPGPVLAAVVAELRAGVPRELVAARFHQSLAGLVRRVCGRAREEHGVEAVALTGGVFANAVLLGACTRALRADGFTVLRHRLVPPGDGGLALGQLMVAAHAAAPAPGGGPRP